MISYVAKVLSAAHLNSTHFTDLQLLTHTKWSDDTKEEHYSFLLLTIPTLASRGDAPILPPTRREALNIPPIKHIFAAHVSEEGNIISILEAGEIARSILRDDHNVGYIFVRRSNCRTTSPMMLLKLHASSSMLPIWPRTVAAAF